MPSYRTHVSVNLFLGLPLGIAGLKYSVLSSPSDLWCFIAAFVYGTLFLHPDLDLARRIRLFSLKGLLTLPFRPYSYLVRHRGWSHIPILGTVTRLLWLLLFFKVVFYCLDWAFPHKIDWNQSYIWFALAGFGLADFFHVLLDRIKT